MSYQKEIEDYVNNGTYDYKVDSYGNFTIDANNPSFNSKYISFTLNDFVYAPAKGEYIAVSEIQATCDERLGAMPENAPVWKTILRNPKKEDVLKGFFNTLKESKTTGAALAIAFAENTFIARVSS